MGLKNFLKFSKTWVLKFHLLIFSEWQITEFYILKNFWMNPLKTVEVISTSDLQERGYLSLQFSKCLGEWKMAREHWNCSLVMLWNTQVHCLTGVSSHGPTACSVVPEYILTHTQGGKEALPAAFSKGEAQCLTAPRSHRDWREA